MLAGAAGIIFFHQIAKGEMYSAMISKGHFNLTLLAPFVSGIQILLYILVISFCLSV